MLLEGTEARETTQVIYRSSMEGLGWGAGTINGKEERVRESWLQRRNDSSLGWSVMAEPTVGIGIQRESCALRSNGEFDFKHDDFKKIEFIYVGMKTFKSHHCIKNTNVTSSLKASKTK